MLPAVGKSPSQLRQSNARIVLDTLRSTGPSAVSALMEASGLTRATVLAVCEELVERGWVVELDNQRAFGADYTVGRPARRFDFHAAAGLVLGVDLDTTTALAVAADARGHELVRREAAMPALSDSFASRLDAVDELCLATVLAAQEELGVPAPLLAVTIGLPAPVDRSGRVVGANPFWSRFDLDLPRVLADRHGWAVRLDNDANLAALAECWYGAAQGCGDVVVLLSNQRLGAGVVEDGRLLRGHRGGVGELGFLTLVDGVGLPYGMGRLVRDWTGDDPDAVYAAAAAGDEAASAVLDRLTARLARVIAVTATLTNPEVVVLAGAHSAAATVVRPALTERLNELMDDPPRVATSSLGSAVVALGAASQALADLRERALAVDLTALSDASSLESPAARPSPR